MKLKFSPGLLISLANKVIVRVCWRPICLFSCPIWLLFFINVAVFQNVNNYFDKYNVIRTNRNADQAYEKTIQHLIILNYPLRRLRLTTENLWRHSEGCGCLAKVSMKETSRNLIFPHSSLQEFICQRARGPSAAKCSYLPDGTTVIMSIIVQVSKVIPTPYVQLSHDAF